MCACVWVCVRCVYVCMCVFVCWRLVDRYGLLVYVLGVLACMLSLIQVDQTSILMLGMYVHCLCVHVRFCVCVRA